MHTYETSFQAKPNDANLFQVNVPVDASPELIAHSFMGAIVNRMMSTQVPMKDAYIVSLGNVPEAARELMKGYVEKLNESGYNIELV